MSEDAPKKGPAARALEEGRSFNIKILQAAYTPLTDESGVPKSRIRPYLPVLDACSLCPSRCCRLTVKLSLPDAVHYCNTLQVPFFAGLTFTPGDHVHHAFAVDRDARIVPETDGWPGKAEIMLRRSEDGACQSLIRVGGYERCGVYEARPSLCRLYPAAWNSDVAKGGPEAILCPVAYGIAPAEEARLKEHIERSILFWEWHDDVVQAWNESEEPRTTEAFLEFAVPRTIEKMGLDASVRDVVLASGHPEQRMFKRMVDQEMLKGVPSPPTDTQNYYAGLIPKPVGG